MTWLKKNFLDWIKIDNDIDIFDEDMQTLNRPVLALGVLKHSSDSTFDVLEHFCDGFGKRFVSLALDVLPWFIKRLLLIRDMHSLFEGRTVVFKG